MQTTTPSRLSASHANGGSPLPRSRGGFEVGPQRTLKNSISCSGITLHSGDKVTMTLHPAPEDHGIVFRRTDIAGLGRLIPAQWNLVVETMLCSTLGNEDNIRVATVEHLMAALAGAGIDNALIEINGPEVPIMDGSAAPFVFLIECAGVAEQAKARRVLEVLRPVQVRDGRSLARLTPAAEWTVECEIEFDSKVIGRQVGASSVEAWMFRSEIARARTFGFHQDVVQLLESGLIKGGSLDNAVVVSGDKVMNEGGLRFEDEFVRHKILDAIGDLYLAGGPLRAAYRGVRPGHHINNLLLRALMADTSAWRWTSEPANLDALERLERIAV